MSLKQQVAHNTIAQIAGKAVSTALGVITIMIMTRALGVERFGWYITATSFLQFFGIISDFGFTVVTANMLSEPRFDKKKLFDTLFTIRFFTALLLNCIAPLSIMLFPYPAPIKIATAIMTISFFSVYLNQVFVAYYQVKLRMHIQAIGEVISRAALVVGAALAAHQNWGFLPLVTVVALAALTNTVYLWLKSEGVRLAFDKEIGSAVWHKMWPVAISVIFNAFYLQGDKVILPLYASQTDVGIYGAATRVIETIIPVPALLMGTMLPLLTFSWSRKDNKNFAQRAQWSFNIVNLFLLPTVAGILAISTALMVFVAGSDFAGSGAILAVLSWKLIGISFGMIFSHFLLAAGKQKLSMWVYIIDAILCVAGFMYFIPKYGLYGAAGVSLFSEIFAGLGLSILAIHQLRFVPHFVDFAKISLASAIMGYAIYSLQPIHIIWSLLLGAIIYSLLIYIFGVVKKEMIKEIIGPKKFPTEPPSEIPVV
ncbi:oligosaccharide flippase family protein [Patescibacteria group bacterium]|nr:oligosaccharide flippase family protein [Patescibacteria group bacterium]